MEPEVSVGAGYAFTNNLDLHLAYTYIGGANDQSVEVNNLAGANAAYLPKAKVYSSNMVMLGLSYTF